MLFGGRAVVAQRRKLKLFPACQVKTVMCIRRGMRRLRNAALMYGITFLSACAAIGPSYQQPEAHSDNDLALIVMYREATFTGSVVSLKFWINETHVSSLGIGGYTYFYLPKGDYKISSGYRMSQSISLSNVVSIEPGKEYYFKASHKAPSKGVVVTSSYESEEWVAMMDPSAFFMIPVTISSHLSLIEKSVAVEELTSGYNYSSARQSIFFRKAADSQ